MLGRPELRQAIAEHDRRFYDLEIDWQAETMVTAGATEALAAAILGLIDPGDEVVLIEPLTHNYLPIVRRAGGVVILVQLAPPDWSFSRDDLAAAFGPRTKLVVVNSSMVPTGKVFDTDELGAIAELAQRYDAYVVCDETFEHIVFDGRRHVPLLSLPEMRERAIRIGDAGPTFAVPGWPVGFVSAGAQLIAPIAKAQRYLAVASAANLQAAIAVGLGQPDDFFAGLAADMQARRGRLAEGLGRLDFDVLDSQGTYFLNAGVAGLPVDGDDEAISLTLAIEARVAAVPLSAFYQEGEVRGYLRFCFAQREDVLDAALARLDTFLASLRLAVPVADVPADTVDATAEAAAEQPVDEAATEQPVDEAAAEQPVDEAAAEQPVDEAATEQPVDEAAAEQPVDEAATEQPVDEAATEQPVDEAATEQPVDEAATEQPVDEAATEQPVDEAATEQPVDEAATEQPVDEAATEQPVDEAATEQPVGETVVMARAIFDNGAKAEPDTAQDSGSEAAAAVDVVMRDAVADVSDDDSSVLGLQVPDAVVVAPVAVPPDDQQTPDSEADEEALVLPDTAGGGFANAGPAVRDDDLDAPVDELILAVALTPEHEIEAPEIDDAGASSDPPAADEEERDDRTDDTPASRGDGGVGDAPD